MDEAEFMRRLAPRVEQFLPVVEGETFASYTERVRTEPIEGRKALIAARLVEVSEEMERERRARGQAIKDAWIAAARKAFSPGPRADCVVCGKYRYLTHAHHLYPLGQQYEDGVMGVDQSHVWLCPNHHAVVHLLINRHELESQALGRRAAPAVLDLEPDELRAVMAILGQRDPGAQ